MSIRDLLDYINKPNFAPFETVCQIKVELAYRGWGEEIKYFPFQPGKEDETRAKEECREFLATQPPGEWKQKPTKGILTTLLKDSILTHPEGKFNTDWVDFIPESHNNNWAEESLSDEQKAIVSGDMPYNTIVNHLEKIADLLLGDEPVWGLVVQEIDQWQKAKGKVRKRNDKEEPYRFYVIKEVFKNEAEALKRAKKIKKNSPMSVPTETNQLSNTAIKSWTTLESLKNDGYADIKADIQKGDPISQICANYQIEESDLALIGLANPL